MVVKEKTHECPNCHHTIKQKGLYNLFQKTGIRGKGKMVTAREYKCNVCNCGFITSYHGNKLIKIYNHGESKW
jgi:hypothetical protein